VRPGDVLQRFFAEAQEQSPHPVATNASIVAMLGWIIPAPLAQPTRMNSLACHHERSGRGFWARVRGADRER